MKIQVLEDKLGQYFSLHRGKHYCSADRGYCEYCDQGGHLFDELEDAGVSPELTLFHEGRLWKGRHVGGSESQYFDWDDQEFRFRPIEGEPWEDLNVARRRLEDRIRKDNEALKKCLVLLGIK